MKIYNVEDLCSVDSEAAVIATLIVHPDFIFSSDFLIPEHFTNEINRYMYKAIYELVTDKEVHCIDELNIKSRWEKGDYPNKLLSNEAFETMKETIDRAKVSITVRNEVKSYVELASTIVDLALRKDAVYRLERCKSICMDLTEGQVSKKIYDTIDEVMTEYSTMDEVPQYKDVIDSCWAEIEARQSNGYAGIPFKFKTLNDFATIEPGELFIFAAEAKQGKSIMLLNCAMDLLKKGKKVLYIDSELNTRLFTARTLSHLTGIEYKLLTAGKYEDEERQRILRAKEWLKQQDFTHIYIPMFDQQTIYTTIKKVYHTQGIDVIIIDYFKGSSDGDAWSSYAELGRFTDMIKNEICGKLNIAGIGAAQATSYGRVADSAKIGRNASTIAMILDKTPEEIEQDGEECGNKKLRILLNRNGMQHAPGEYIDLNFDGNHILYEEAKQHIPVMPY